MLLDDILTMTFSETILESTSMFNYLKRKQAQKAQKNLATGAIIGGLVGGILTLFLSPFTGKQARKIAADKAKKVHSLSKNAVTNIKSQISQTAQNVKTTLKKGEENAKNAALNLSDKVIQGAENTKAKISQIDSDEDDQKNSKK
jgi:gas vesicle protein